MKGLFDERKLQKFKSLQQHTEPIYFEVSVYQRPKSKVYITYYILYICKVIEVEWGDRPKTARIKGLCTTNASYFIRTAFVAELQA